MAEEKTLQEQIAGIDESRMEIFGALMFAMHNKNEAQFQEILAGLDAEDRDELVAGLKHQRDFLAGYFDKHPEGV